MHTLVQARHLDRRREGGAVRVGRIVCAHAPDDRPGPVKVPRVVHLGPQLCGVPVSMYRSLISSSCIHTSSTAEGVPRQLYVLPSNVLIGQAWQKSSW